MKDNGNMSTSEGKPVRFDISNTILKQLSKPLHSLSSETKSPIAESNPDDTCITIDMSKQDEV